MGGAASLPGAAALANVAPAANVPTEDQVDAAKTLTELRAQEGAIMRDTRVHEDALGKLQTLYKRVRAKMYRDHKSAVIAEDNSALQQFQSGCPKPKEVANKEELDAQATCMQRVAQEVDDSDLGLLMRRHLKAPIPPLPAGATCGAFRQIDPSQLAPKARSCLARVGDARWTADGLVELADANATAGVGAPTSCGRTWQGTAEARCLLSGKDLVFFGNSVVRRQMYTLLDVLAGPVAHRQLTNFTDVLLPNPDERSVARSWIWDQDNMTRGYHASQLFTVDLATGTRTRARARRRAAVVARARCVLRGWRRASLLPPSHPTPRFAPRFAPLASAAHDLASLRAARRSARVALSQASTASPCRTRRTVG
jgi:hypothetical protein